jgi:hypothetical protein
MQSVFPAVAGRLGAFLGCDAQVLQLESEIADAYEQSVEVCLVSDLADELGPTGVAHWRHPLKSFREAIAEPAAHDDPGLDGPIALVRRSRCVHGPSVGCVWVMPHHPARTSPRRSSLRPARS